MASERKIARQATKRAGSPVESEPIVDWSENYSFISPNEINSQAIGLLFCLTTKRLINVPFTTLYQRSLKIRWSDLLIRERRNLKSNISSVAKCFVLNRLIAECTKNPYQFAHQTGELYEAIKTRMSSALPPTLTAEDFFQHVCRQQHLLTQRRLFHMSDDADHRPASLLTLQRVASQLYAQFLHSCQTTRTIENRNHLKRLLEHCFLIVEQPSVPECVAATKYDKKSDGYTAKLFSRVICLLHPDIIEKHLTLSNVKVTLYPFDRSLDTCGEVQRALTWHARGISDADGELRSFWYVELESIESQKLDARGTRPLYSAKLCELQFQIDVQIKELNVKENLIYLSQPFGLCSHAQYYPEYVAKVLLHEVASKNNWIIQPDVLTDYIAWYYVRITGMIMKPHTTEYIKSLFQSLPEERKGMPGIPSFDKYEETLARIVSQMEMFTAHPFLSMMYHDGLFLGICDSSVDQRLQGTRDEPHILLRFNTLSTHQPTQHASVRFIVHNGQLIRATFHGKAFVDEMCRMICEAHSERAGKIRLLYETPDRSFSDFISYFDQELFRLHTAASPLEDAYQPFIPILWNTMRANFDSTGQQLNSPSSNLECSPIDLSETSTYSTNATQITPSSTALTTNQWSASTGKISIRTNVLVRQVAEKLSQLLTDSSTGNVSSTSAHITRATALVSTLTEQNVDRQKRLLTRLLHDYFPTQNRVEVSTQTSTPTSDASPVNMADDN